MEPVNEITKGTTETSIPSVSEVLISALGYDQFVRIYRLFREVRLDKVHDYKVFMARKCYALYKAFEPVLNEDEIGIQGVITNDKMLGICKNDILNASSKKNILVIDDTILFGRTLRNFLFRLESDYHITREQLSLFVLYASTDRKEPGQSPDNFPQVTVDGNGDADLFKYGDKSYKFWHPENSYVAFYGIDKVRGYSSRLIEAIHAVSAPYVAYIPAFQVSGDSIWKIIERTDNDPWKNPTLIDHNYQGFDISFEEYDELYDCDLNAFCLIYPSKLLCDSVQNVSYLCVRIYPNARLHMLTVIPYVVLTNLEKTSNKEILGFDVFNTYFRGENAINDQQTELSFLRYAASYLLGKEFFDEYDISKSDIRLLTTEGFGTKDISLSLDKMNLSKFDFLADNSTYKMISDETVWVAENVSNTNQEVNELNKLCKESNYTYTNFINSNDQFDFIYKLLCSYYANVLMQDSGKERFKGLSISFVYDRLRELFDINRDYFLAAMVKIGDSGRATLTVRIEGNMAFCIAQNGEQAAQFMGRLCQGFTYAVSVLFTTLSRKNDWDTYKADIIKKLYLYVKRSQEKCNDIPVSEAELKTIIDCENPKQWHMDSVNYYIPNGTPEADFMADFTYAYLDWINKANGMGSFSKYLTKESRKFIFKMDVNLD
jgi:hypothetical protein